MFSYRHAFHAGNHADVLKHITLLATLRHLMRKDSPLLLVDTHAGAGIYRLDGGAAQTANGVHVAFLAESTAQVHAFHAAALAHGARCDGPPGPRPHYGAEYHGCFVRDLDGHKIEAMFWNPDA